MDDLRVRLLGDLAIEGCELSLLRRRQTRTLVKVLALHHGQPVSGDRLSECLWGEEPPTRAAAQISVLVSRLRRIVGAEHIRRSDAGYTLALDWLDVDALADYAGEAERRLAAGAVGAARAAGTAGLALLRGPFLADEPDPWWAHNEAARVEHLIGRLYHAAGQAALAAGDTAAASTLAEATLQADPFDEVALRIQMTALAESGRSASALAAYGRFRSHLADELGVSPSPETESLHLDLLMGRDVPAIDTARPRSSAVVADLPGRADALARLDAVIERSVGGNGQVVLVEGEAGIGKSRLLDAFCVRAGGRMRVVRVSGDELGRTLPLQPVLDAVFELVEDMGAARVLGPDASLLGPLLGFQDQPLAASQLAALTDPGAGQALLFAAVDNVLRRQSHTTPLAIALDDLHLAGPATTTWLAQAVRRLATCPLAIVAARREEEATAVPGVETIRLGPLDVAAAAQVVGDDRAAELHRRSGGHPLFLVELAAAPEGEELPLTILQSVEGRCARAGPAAATLRTAAVIGAVADLDLLASVTGQTTSDLIDHLEEGVRRRLLVEETSFEFRHSLIRQALASTVGPTRATYIHRRVGRALRARPNADPLVVAHHARLGGDRHLASSMLITAARAAVARFSPDAAADLLDQAIAEEDSAEARVERARVRTLQLHYADARADVAAAQAQGAGAEALEAGAWVAHFERHFDEALRLADQGATLAVQADAGEVGASCLGLGGWVSLAAGDLAGARWRLERAAAEQPANGLARAWMGWLHVNEGRPEEALALAYPDIAQGLASYRFPNAYALMAATMGLAMVGRAGEALVAASTLGEEVERMGAARWVPRALNLRGWIVRNLGQPEEADELNLAALAHAQPLDLAEPLAYGLLDLAAGRLLAGDLDGARDRLGEAQPISQIEHAFAWRGQHRLRLLQARLDLAAGDAVAAWAGASALAGDAESVGAARAAVQARLVVAAAAAAAARAGPASAVPGPVPEAAGVQRLLDRLAEVAGLESWWITAEVAEAFGSDAWTELARRRVAGLLAHAGPYREALARAAKARGLG